MEKILIRLEDVSFSYGSQQVLDRVSFDLERNSFYAITGSNGSGKSTLVKILLGLIKPSSGEITHYNLENEQMGYVAQKGLGQSMGFPASVEEVVGLPLNISKNRKTRKERKERVNEVLQRLEIEPLRKRLISQLSGGQLQRVLIARELISEPSILFLDEPTNALDKQMVKSLFDLLAELRQQGITIVLITHSDEHLRDIDHKEFRVEDHQILEIRGDQGA